MRESGYRAERLPAAEAEHHETGAQGDDAEDLVRSRTLLEQHQAADDRDEDERCRRSRGHRDLTDLGPPREERHSRNVAEPDGHGDPKVPRAGMPRNAASPDCGSDE